MLILDGIYIGIIIALYAVLCGSFLYVLEADKENEFSLIANIVLSMLLSLIAFPAALIFFMFASKQQKQNLLNDFAQIGK